MAVRVAHGRSWRQFAGSQCWRSRFGGAGCMGWHADMSSLRSAMKLEKMGQ